jgi:2-C-methyl-D-erythritol 2,4-cyclodiphosphate synthase
VRHRVGLGFDVHPFGQQPPLVLGGIRIEEAPRLAGHSDGDAVAHAVADALLGPAGLPDLGTMFPASDDTLRDADSIVLLREVATRLSRDRWWIDNVDIVVAAEQPKLAPYTAAMAERVIDALAPAREPMGHGIEVTVKPKRGEGLGAIGRAEGIAVWAVALLARS